MYARLVPQDMIPSIEVLFGHNYENLVSLSTKHDKLWTTCGFEKEASGAGAMRAMESSINMTRAIVDATLGVAMQELYDAQIGSVH